MSESLVGRAVASTRQNAGSVIAVVAPGGVNGPATPAVDERIVTPGIVSAARFAHAVPFDEAGAITSVSRGIIATTRAAHVRRVMGMASSGPPIIRRNHEPPDLSS